VHHSDRVLETVEPGDLGHDGTRTVDAKFITDFLDLRVVKILIFLRERIDAGIKQILRDGQLPGKRLGRKDGCVVLLNQRAQKFPDMSIRTR
jgi:hypothetical protein